MHACSFIIYEVVFLHLFLFTVLFLVIAFLKLLGILVFIIRQTDVMYGYRLNEVEVFFPVTN